MFSEKQKSQIKDIVLKALEDFEDLQINLKSANAREVIAVRIASDLTSDDYETPVSPSDVKKY